MPEQSPGGTPTLEMMQALHRILRVNAGLLVSLRILELVANCKFTD